MCQTNASILHPFPVAAGKTNCRISKIVVPLFTASAPKLISSEAYINLAKQAKVVAWKSSFSSSILNFESASSLKHGTYRETRCGRGQCLTLNAPTNWLPKTHAKSVPHHNSPTMIFRPSPNLQPACAPQMCTPSTFPSDSEAI